MPFPKTDRYIYKRNPLDKVICQIRYPPILKIDTELPSAFQEKIREIFPLYTEKIELQQETAIGIKTPLSPESFRQLTKSEMYKNHEFSSHDGIWKINLTRTFLSLSTSKYIRWEEFIDMFESSIDALISLYSPPFFTRIGLRYIDIFDRTKLNLDGCNWTELIKDYFLGLLSSDIGDRIKNFENIYEVKLSDNTSIVRIVTSFVMNLKSKEQCYMVDSDFHFPQRTDIKELNTRLIFLHERATRLIRWIIKDKLHAAMEPEKI